MWTGLGSVSSLPGLCSLLLPSQAPVSSSSAHAVNLQWTLGFNLNNWIAWKRLVSQGFLFRGGIQYKHISEIACRANLPRSSSFQLCWSFFELPQLDNKVYEAKESWVVYCCIFLLKVTQPKVFAVFFLVILLLYLLFSVIFTKACELSQQVCLKPLPTSGYHQSS